MEKNDFSAKLRKIREAAGLTQKELAGKLGITYTKYNHYETGRNEPDIDTIIQLSDFFEVPADYLLRRNPLTKEKMSLSPDKKRLIEELCDADDETAKEIEQYLNYLKAKKEQAATGTER